MKTGSTSYMRESFVERLFQKSVPRLEESLCSAPIESAVLVQIRSVYIQYCIGSAIVMAAAMNSCSTAILAAKSVLQI